jgi:hypothetical protein
LPALWTKLRLTPLCLSLLTGGFQTSAGEITTIYEITINGQKFGMNAESTTNVVVDGCKLSLAAREKPEKTFSDGNLTFAFPSTHAVSKDVEAGVTTWKLDGQGNVMLLLRVEGADSKGVAQESVAALKAQYGAGAKQSHCQLAVGEESLPGKRLTAVFAGVTVNQEIYEFNAGTAGYCLVLVDPGGPASLKTREVKKLLRETFSRQPAPATKEVKELPTRG